MANPYKNVRRCLQMYRGCAGAAASFMRWCSCLLLAVMIARSAFAGTPGTTATSFLKIGVGARSVSMGEAFVAIADDANAVVYNPAGLAWVTDSQFSAMHMEYLQNIKYDSLSYARPFKTGTIGIHVGYLYMNDIKRTLYEEDEVYTQLGNFGAGDRTLVAGIGKKLSGTMSIGLSARFLRETLDDVSASAISADIGAIYKPFSTSRKNEPWLQGLAFGAALQNFGTEMKFIEVRERLPVLMRLGISDVFLNGKLRAGFEFYKPFADYPELKAGVETELFGVLFLRAGYRYRTWQRANELGEISGITAGFGVVIYNYTVDYAFVPYGDLGNSHRLSLGGKF
jgi:hypothetical protein